MQPIYIENMLSLAAKVMPLPNAYILMLGGRLCAAHDGIYAADRPGIIQADNFGIGALKKCRMKLVAVVDGGSLSLGEAVKIYADYMKDFGTVNSYACCIEFLKRLTEAEIDGDGIVPVKVAEIRESFNSIASYAVRGLVTGEEVLLKKLYMLTTRKRFIVAVHDDLFDPRASCLYYESYDYEDDSVYSRAADIATSSKALDTKKTFSVCTFRSTQYKRTVCADMEIWKSKVPQLSEILLSLC